MKKIVTLILIAMLPVIVNAQERSTTPEQIVGILENASILFADLDVKGGQSREAYDVGQSLVLGKRALLFLLEQRAGKDKEIAELNLKVNKLTDKIAELEKVVVEKEVKK